MTSHIKLLKPRVVIMISKNRVSIFDARYLLVPLPGRPLFTLLYHYTSNSLSSGVSNGRASDKEEEEDDNDDCDAIF
jgi:hypothetical protein